MTDTSDFLLNRRSIVVRNMAEPGPTNEDLEKILRAGMRVPDHGRLTPWRFIIIRGDARDQMGKVLGEAFRAANPDCIDEQVEIEKERFARARRSSSPWCPEPFGNTRFPYGSRFCHRARRAKTC